MYEADLTERICYQATGYRTVNAADWVFGVNYIGQRMEGNTSRSYTQTRGYQKKGNFTTLLLWKLPYPSNYLFMGDNRRPGGGYIYMHAALYPNLSPTATWAGLLFRAHGNTTVVAWADGHAGAASDSELRRKYIKTFEYAIY